MRKLCGVLALALFFPLLTTPAFAARPFWQSFRPFWYFWQQTSEKPDLAVEDIKFYRPGSGEQPQDEVAPAIGEPVICKAVLKNIGKANTGVFNVKWFLDGSLKGYGSHRSLAVSAGSNDNIRFNWVPTEGSHTLKFVADPDNHITETDEGNNAFEKAVSPIIAPKPDLTVTGIKFYRLRSKELPEDEVTPVTGQLVTCKAVLKNTGDAPAAVFNVKWFLDEELKGYGSHASLSAQAASDGNVRFDWLSAGGTHTLKFVADCDNYINESNEANNVFASVVTLPLISSITPQDGSTFLAGTKLIIQITPVSAGIPLEYRFSIGTEIKQSWSSSNTYAWQTTSQDAGTVSLTCEAKDNTGQIDSKTISCRIINPAVEEVLKQAADNYAKIYDFTADMALSSTLDGKPFGETDYCKYYFKAPDKEKTESFSDSTRATKTEVIINNGSNMYLIDSVNKLTQEVDLLAEAGISASEFNQMDMYYNQANFLSNHTVTRNNNGTDFDNFIIALDAIPKAPNNLYSKLELFIDYKKGLVTKIEQYKNEELPQIIEAIETKLMPNGAWIISKVKKIPNLKSGNLIVILTYDNIHINIGLNDLDFDPDKQ